MTDFIVQQAKDAIEEVFSDGLVPLETTIRRMEDLREEIDMFLDALRDDLRHQPA